MAESVQARPAVLLVEDEAQLVSLLRDQLDADYEIEVAGTVDEALLLLGTRRFAAIVSDHLLPGKEQGLDFLVEALQRQPEAKRILVTGYMNPELLARAVPLAELSACLMKPVGGAQLRQVLADVIARG